MLHSEYPADTPTKMVFYPRSIDFNQNVAINAVPPSKKSKSQPLSTFRSLFMKGRRKEKDSPPSVPEDEYKQYLEDSHVQERILNTDLTHLVRLPAGLDLHEWLATHTISFFDHINLLYGVIAEYCTATSCATMSAPGNTQYVLSGEKGQGRKDNRSAPNYVNRVLSFTENILQDPAVFPTKYGENFPASFIVYCKKIYRYIFHVIAHMYHAHFKHLLALQLHQHLNLVFYHFTMFSREFNLIERKETELLDDLYDKLHAVTSSSLANTGTCGSTGSGSSNHSGGYVDNANQHSNSTGRSSHHNPSPEHSPVPGVHSGGVCGGVIPSAPPSEPVTSSHPLTAPEDLPHPPHSLVYGDDIDRLSPGLPLPLPPSGSGGSTPPDRVSPTHSSPGGRISPGRVSPAIDGGGGGRGSPGGRNSPGSSRNSPRTGDNKENELGGVMLDPLTGVSQYNPHMNSANISPNPSPTRTQPTPTATPAGKDGGVYGEEDKEITRTVEVGVHRDTSAGTHQHNGSANSNSIHNTSPTLARS